MRQSIPGYNPHFDDWYFTPGEGWDEAEHVFLRGQGFPERFAEQPVWRIGELGFGLGMNLWVLLDALGDFPDCRVSFRSCEAFPPGPDLLRESLAPYQSRLGGSEGLEDALALYAALEPAANGWGPICRPRGQENLDVQVFWGPADLALGELSGTFDAWFLDGHDPKKNPELWTPDLLGAVARLTRIGGSFSSYTAAGSVKSTLRSVGFDLGRKKGYGKKRHMISGLRRP